MPQPPQYRPDSPGSVVNWQMEERRRRVRDGGIQAAVGRCLGASPPRTIANSTSAADAAKNRPAARGGAPVRWPLVGNECEEV